MFLLRRLFYELVMGLTVTLLNKPSEGYPDIFIDTLNYTFFPVAPAIRCILGSGCI
jgi:hypothetical protein